MKTAILFLTICALNLAAQDKSNQTKWTYFTLYLNSNEITNGQDIALFNKLRDDLALYEEPDWRKFQIVVDVRSKSDTVNFIVVGKYNSIDVEYDREALRYTWAQLSKGVQKWLLSWQGNNKINREK